ncbi:diguanylate cyclase (GGDEF) domain-containing protein [Paenisporosarcina sp. HGH0030]|nr:diguanylate cyclase (GGDEF) domain-containing protein [Paenisporosarcina sp. HGH0030]
MTIEIRKAHDWTHIDITERKEIEILLHRSHEELERLVEQVKELSITDHLTSLFNRRKMVEEIRKAQNRFEVSGQSFTLAILDLDHFKNINDQYGHTFGDIALQTFASLLRRKIHDLNVVARWGGEEFIILFQNSNTQEIHRQLLSIQDCCNEELLKYRMDPVPLSFSAGVHEYDIQQSLEDLLKRADQALYIAKSLGRKQIILYEKGLPIV